MVAARWQSARVAALLVVGAAACGSGAGLGERCGEWGHGTISCVDGFYCSLPSGSGTGTCRRAGRLNEPCPEPTLASCAGGLTCNRGSAPPVCTSPIAAGMDCANAVCVDGLICLVKPAGPPTCERRRLENEACLNAYGQCEDGLTCLPYADVPEGGVCGQRVPAGNLCDDVLDCQPGLMCNAGFTPARCEPLSEVGQPCASLQDCKSLNCDVATRTCQAFAAATSSPARR